MSPVLRPIHWQICCGTQLISTNVLELLVLLAESEVGVGGHDAVVLPKVLQLHWTGCLDDRVRKADLQIRGMVKADQSFYVKFSTESPWGPPMALPMWWLADFLQLPQWSFLSTTKETRMRTSRMIGTVIPT